MKFLRFFTLFLGFVAVASLAAASDGVAPGTFRVASTQGSALWLNPPSGPATGLKVGQELPEGAVISTEAGARVVLAFASGSTVVVAEKSEIAVSKFTQEAFNPATADLSKGEPAISDTQIILNKGSVTSKVNKLRAGSNYQVLTPVGAAGVRGTTFNVSYDPVAKVLEIRTAEGEVVFTNATTKVESSVEGGKKLVVSFEFTGEGITVTSANLGDLTAQEIAEVLQILIDTLPQEIVVPIIQQLQQPTVLSDDTILGTQQN